MIVFYWSIVKDKNLPNLKFAHLATGIKINQGQYYSVNNTFLSTLAVIHCNGMYMYTNCTVTAVPSQPERVRVTLIEKNSVTVEWSKPDSDGGSRIRRYIIYKRIEMTEKWVKVTTVEQFTTKTVIEKLEFDKNYFFAVSAENDVGESEKAETSQPTRLGKPTGISPILMSYINLSLVRGFLVGMMKGMNV